MIRQNIILGDYIYITDLYKANIDKEYDNTYSKFVMLRKFDLKNDIVYDTDIFFIEKSLLPKIINDIKTNTNNSTSNIVFPVNLNGAISFNSIFTNFDDDYRIDTFECGKDIYEMYIPTNYEIDKDDISINDFLKIYGKMYNTIESFLSKNTNSTETTYTKNIDLYILLYLMSKRYNSSTWKTYVGKLETDYPDIYNLLNKSYSDILEKNNLICPNGDKLDLAHFAANLAGYYNKHGMITGWAGDLITFANDCNNGTNINDFPTASFGIEDLNADLDASNIYHIYSTTSNDLKNILYTYFTDIYYNRISLFNERYPNSYNAIVHSIDYTNIELLIAFYTRKNGNKDLITNSMILICKMFDNYLNNHVNDINDDNVFYKEASILCDTMRIYHPSNKPHIDAIIYMDNYINDVHFHYFCDLYNNQTINSTTEFTIDNVSYSEYIEFKIPNIEYIFSKTYFKDNLNISTIINNISEIFKLADDNNLICEYNQLNTILTPFVINKITYNNEDIYIKNYLKSENSIYNNYLSASINITISHYTEINSTLGLYLLDADDMVQNSDTFSIPYKFTLSSTMGFDNGIISVINIFNYPNKNMFANVQEAYKAYYNVTEDLYKNYPYVPLTFDELCECVTNDITVYERIDDKFYEFTDDITSFNTLKTTFTANTYYKNLIDINEEYGNSLTFDTNIQSCGYHIMIASDRQFKNIIYSLDVNADFIDDYSFQLNNLFESWNNMPELIVVRTIFVDKYLNEYIYGNDVIITNEWYKYFINDIDNFRLKCLSKTLLNNMKYENNEINGFNFIDKINCVIYKEPDANSKISVNKTNNIRVLYKPVFYKTQDLQNIKIKSVLTQNIGINLSNYLSKVDVFKLIIDNNTFTEYARNDVYVIFKINASLITVTSGQYYVTNEEGEYISDGYFTIY